MGEKKIALSLAVVLVVSAYLIYSGMRESISFYITPSEFHKNMEKYKGKRLKIGGFVSDIKVDGLNHFFILTDGEYSIPVSFQGVPPDLFGKMKGAIVEGFWDTEKNVFRAKTIMAKHDENYRPPGVEHPHTNGRQK